MWQLYQLSIAFAVWCSAIYWNLTPNPYVVGLLAFGAAYSATWLLSKVLTWLGCGSAKSHYQPSSERLSAAGARWDVRHDFKRIPTAPVGEDGRELVKVVAK